MKGIEIKGARVYHDPGLRRSPARYARLLARMLAAGMIEITTERPACTAGLFAVGKKDGRQRLIVDCRQANCHFVDSDDVRLPTVGAISRLSLDDSSPLFVG